MLQNPINERRTPLIVILCLSYLAVATPVNAKVDGAFDDYNPDTAELDVTSWLAVSSGGTEGEIGKEGDTGKLVEGVEGSENSEGSGVMVNAPSENQDQEGAQNANFDDVFNIDDFGETNEYGDEAGMGDMTDRFPASAFESNNAGSTTPSALGGDFTLVSSGDDNNQASNVEASSNQSPPNDTQAQEDTVSVHNSPSDDKEQKPETSLLDQNSPLSELSPLPSHNNSIDMDQENENDDADMKTKAKSRDTSPLSPASSRPPPSSPGATSSSKTQSLTSLGSKSNHVNAVAGPSSSQVGVPPPLSSASSTSATMSPTSKRAEADRKIRTVLEVNAELFSICMAFYSKGILKGPEPEQFSRRLKENLTWLASQADKQSDSLGSEIQLPELTPPTMSVTSIELPSLEKLYSLYAQFPVIFARDIMRRERKSMMGPQSSMNSSTSNLALNTPSPLSAPTQAIGLRNNTESPVSGISTKRDRPEGEGESGSPSPAHKRRDTGEGKSSQNNMMPPPPPPSAASSTGLGDPSQHQQQASNSGLNLGSVGQLSQHGGLSSMGPGLFPSGQNAHSNGLGDLSATGLFSQNTGSVTNVAGSPGGLDARQMQLRMQMGRMSQQQQHQASQLLSQGMGMPSQQQMPPQMQLQNAQSQQSMIPHAARQQEISLGSSVSQSSPPPLGGPNGMPQHQGSAQLQSPAPGQVSPTMALQMPSNNGVAPGQQSGMGYTPPVLDPATLQQIRQHGTTAIQGLQMLQTPNHPLVKRLLQHIPNLAQYPVLDQIRQLIILQQKMTAMVQQIQNQGMWLQQQQFHTHQMNTQYNISQKGNPSMQQNSPYGSNNMPNAGNPMRPSMQQQQQPVQMQQISLGSQMPQQGNADGMSFPNVSMARPVSGGSNPMGGNPGGNAQNSMHLGLPGSLSHLDPQQRRPLLVQQTQQFAQRGGMQQPAMQPGMMNPQMLAAQQQQRPPDLQRFALAQAQAQAQRQTSPLNPNAGPGSPAVGSSSTGPGDIQPNYPPGMQSNSLQGSVPGIARSSRSPSVTDMGAPRLSGGPSVMQGMGMGMGLPGQQGQGQLSNDEYQRQLAYLASQRKVQQQQAPQNPQSQLQQLGPTAWPQQQASNFAYGQQGQPGSASSWSPMGFQQQQGFQHAASPTGGMRHATPDQSGVARQSSSTPAPNPMAMSMQQQSQSPVVPDSGFDMVNWGSG
ncbi:hypothetical protein SCHPADRAFT_995596 [Schizopora paradoxa]|uniref:Uncharacterized protein n=1 Tax=Schizopora paradoxa TaxID=27342 RepID=A0A0H2RV38_9AGAM|nr:hypothetical protein SCHPADRAFT_995596 [Schizopora paradoxa]